MTLPRINRIADMVDPIFDAAAYGERDVLIEEAFRRRIAIERKRTERSRETVSADAAGSGLDPEWR